MSWRKEEEEEKEEVTNALVPNASYDVATHTHQRERGGHKNQRIVFPHFAKKHPSARDRDIIQTSGGECFFFNHLKEFVKAFFLSLHHFVKKNRFHNKCFSSGGNEDDEPDKMAIAFGRFGTFKRFLVRSSITMPSPSQILLSGFNNKLF